MSEILPILPLEGSISGLGTLTGSLSSKREILAGKLSMDVSYPTYDGTYVIVPKRYEQSLDTSDKLLTDDVTVQEVPYQEAMNESGGYTFNIAYIP